MHQFAATFQSLEHAAVFKTFPAINSEIMGSIDQDIA